MKRFLSLILCLMMVFGLMGCAGAASEEDKALVKTILTDAAARKEAILNSPTQIVKADGYIPGETYTGTAYYVSNSGSDSNDGLSPATAFATLAPFKSMDAKHGDAVLFERGGIWRGQMVPYRLKDTAGITYSTYGEGEKPKLYGSPESGVGEEKWTLAYEDGEKKIWTFHSEMSEVAAIVLNGETIVKRSVAHWDGSTYHVMGNSYDRITDEVYTVEEHLEDMHCFPLLDYPDSGHVADDVYITGFGEDGPEFLMGTLYFRCDAGNPGALYDEIEFIAPDFFLAGMSDDTVLDNLDIQFSGSTLCTGRTEDMRAENCVIQNCQVGWIGGALYSYGGRMEGDDRTYLSEAPINQNGGCISVNGSNAIVRNNYVHHGYQEGIAIETFRGDPHLENVLVSGNLVEKCVQPILICSWDEMTDPDHLIKNWVIEDNYALYQGVDNWYYFTDEVSGEAMVKLQGGPCAHDGTLSVRNNVFAFGVGRIVHVDLHTQKYSCVFSENTYVQYNDKCMFTLIKQDSNPANYRNPSADGFAKKLGDTAATVVYMTEEELSSLRESLGY